MLFFQTSKKIKVNNRLCYEITKEGKELKVILHKIKDWAIKNDLDIPSECKKDICQCHELFKNK